MTQLKFRICVILLAFSLALTVGTVLILRNSHQNDQPSLPSDSLADQQQTDPAVSVPDSLQTAETTQATTEATTVATTEPTTEPTEEETTVPETTVAEETEPANKDIGAAVAKIAAAQVGKPYKYGTAGPDSFDTSGLVQYCFKECGISVARSNSGLAQTGYVVDKEKILPGDAVFFWSSKPGTAEYLGIYIGGGKVVAALNESKPVIEFNMNSAYYTEHFVFVRRFY